MGRAVSVYLRSRQAHYRPHAGPCAAMAGRGKTASVTRPLHVRVMEILHERLPAVAGRSFRPGDTGKHHGSWDFQTLIRMKMLNLSFPNSSLGTQSLCETLFPSQR